MVLVSEIIKALSAKNPQAAPARLAFFNFLNYGCNPEDSFGEETLELFYSFCSDYTHWQQFREELCNEVRSQLKILTNDFQTDLTFQGYKHFDQLQVIELQQPSDFSDALQGYLKNSLDKADQYRLIADGKKMTAVILKKDLSVEVHRYDRRFTIEHGQLRPLRKDLVLKYTEALELDPLYQQRLEIAPFVHLYFEGLNGSISGTVLRGYLCQKHQEFRSEKIENQPKILMALKRLEQTFINRQSDPFYQALTQRVEKVLTQTRLRDPEGLAQATNALLEAQTYLESVFVDDKLLSLLVRELELTLAQIGPLSQKDTQSWPQFVSTNSSQIQV
jgi:hypothetical protein